MRFDDIFNDIDDKTAEKLSEEYPVLSDEQKERLYAMSKRKYDINDMPELNNNEVSGVESYRRPKWYKGLSIAAAAVLVVAGIGGATAVISRNGHAPASEVESVVTTEEVTEAETEEVTEAAEPVTDAEEIDADAIAQEMVDEYIACLSDLWGRTLQVDTSDVVVKEFPDDGITHTYYRVVDPRYPTWEDLEKRCYEVFDTELGEIILESRDVCYAPEEEMTYNTLFFTRGDSYYRRADIDIDPKSVVWDQEHAEGDLTPEGDILTTMTITYTDCSPNYVLQTDFRFVKTENGWRINKADESSYPIGEGADIASEPFSFDEYTTGEEVTAEGESAQD